MCVCCMGVGVCWSLAASHQARLEPSFWFSKTMVSLDVVMLAQVDVVMILSRSVGTSPCLIGVGTLLEIP